MNDEKPSLLHKLACYSIAAGAIVVLGGVAVASAVASAFSSPPSTNGNLDLPELTPEEIQDLTDEQNMWDDD